MMMDTDGLRLKFREEICRSDWEPLQQPFARGTLLALSPELELVDTAIALAQDDGTQIKEWLEAKLLWKPEIVDAERWHESKTTFEMLIVQPYVLVQPSQT